MEDNNKPLDAEQDAITIILGKFGDFRKRKRQSKLESKCQKCGADKSSCGCNEAEEGVENEPENT